MGTWKKLAYQDDVITKALLTEQGDIIYASAASTPAALAHGLATQYLKSGGNAANPSWDTPAGGGLTSKIITATRVLSVASGNVAYTGVGFVPTVIIAWECCTGGYDSQSWGFSDSNKAVRCLYTYNNIGAAGDGAYLIAAGDYTSAPTTRGQTAVIVSYDADGFTLTWTKYGLATETANLYFLCLK